MLFIMFAGQPPFSIATQQCPFYTQIINQRADLFWKAQELNKEPGYYSQDFKDIVTLMLQNNSEVRLQISDLLGCPWLRGEIATPEEVHADFF